MNDSLDQYVQKDRCPETMRSSPLEKMKGPEKLKRVDPDPDDVIKPMDSLHILRVQNREQDLPAAPREKADIPVIPDRKKAEEDYNSIDYQIIAFNLWQSKARSD